MLMFVMTTSYYTITQTLVSLVWIIASQSLDNQNLKIVPTRQKASGSSSRPVKKIRHVQGRRVSEGGLVVVR